MPLTRRKLLIDSAQVAGGALAMGMTGRAAAALAAEPVNKLTASPPDLGGPALGNGGYWGFADWLAKYFDQLWDGDRGYYRSGTSVNGRIYHNSAFLTTHAIAALVGHEGDSRRDDRARRLARRLCDSPPWSERQSPIEPDPQFHVPGWVESMNTTEASMDKSIDPKVAEALMYAWRARAQLRLPQDTVTMIEDRVARCALGSFYRFPNVRLNQINWHSEMYAHFATVTGVPDLLKLDYRQQMERFVAGITHPLAAGGSPNLGPGYRFHYLPHKPPDHGLNVDSAEYANMTCHFLIWYEQALRAGMQPLAPEHVRLLRAWVEHIVCGYWTHAGYLNWDTGFGFKRWHQGRTFALARQGLFAIALSPRFHNMPELGSWAKYMFDAGFRLFARLARDAPDGLGIPAGVLFDIKVNPLGPSVRELFAARMQADAARAVVQGLERVPAVQPPPLYSFDPDIGRLAVTTPSYSTAIVPVSQHAIPYGGIELARLHGSDAGPIANIGGRPWASFGVVVRNASSRAVLRSQQPSTFADPLRPALQLVSSPRGAVRRAQQYPARPYAGSFKSLVARGHRESSEAAVEVTYRFRDSSIGARWKVTRRKRARYSVDVLFPSWGKGAVIEAVLRDKQRVRLAGPLQRRRRVRMRNVAYFYIAGEEGGYVVVPAGRRRGSGHVFKPKTQAAAPKPGPTLAVALASRAKFRRLDFAAEIAPASSVQHADAVARRLMARLGRPAPKRTRGKRRGNRRRRRRRS
jgi:hypothetical protein